MHLLERVCDSSKEFERWNARNEIPPSRSEIKERGDTWPNAPRREF